MATEDTATGGGVAHARTVNPNGWYTTQQAAALIGVSRDTVVVWIEAGVMACHRNPDLSGRGRTRRRIEGAEVLRVIGTRVLDAQPAVPNEPLAKRVRRGLTRLAAVLGKTKAKTKGAKR